MARRCTEYRFEAVAETLSTFERFDNLLISLPHMFLFLKSAYTVLTLPIGYLIIQKSSFFHGYSIQYLTFFRDFLQVFNHETNQSMSTTFKLNWIQSKEKSLFHKIDIRNTLQIWIISKLKLNFKNNFLTNILVVSLCWSSFLFWNYLNPNFYHLIPFPRLFYGIKISFLNVSIN
jgi:hypothetical protein